MRILTAIKRLAAVDPLPRGLTRLYVSETPAEAVTPYVVLEPGTGDFGRDSGSEFRQEPFEVRVHSSISRQEAVDLCDEVLLWLERTTVNWPALGVAVVRLIPKDRDQGQDADRTHWASNDIDCEVEVDRAL